MDELNDRPTRTPQRQTGRRPTQAATWIGALGLAALLALTPVAAQDGCVQVDRNAQCTEFGTIAMDSQTSIRGQPVDLTADINLNTGYEDQGARWLLFSVRNIEADGSNPITIDLVRFSTAYGDIVTTRVEHATANELNLWVDILDTPVATPIALDLRIGATERGAFKLETLVMAFDRGYAPIVDSSGNEASLFSFTLVGVNDESGGTHADGGSLFDGKKTPALGVLPLLAVLATLSVLLRRRP